METKFSFLIAALICLFSFQAFSQTSYSEITVIKKSGLNSSSFFSEERHSIDFIVIKVITDYVDTNFRVAITVDSEKSVQVGSSKAVLINSNFDVAFASSSINQLYTRNEYLEISKEQFNEVFSFINSSMGKANPKQELETAFIMKMEEGFKIALIYNGKNWHYVFTLNGAEYMVTFQDSIEIIISLQEMNELLKSL